MTNGAADATITWDLYDTAGDPLGIVTQNSNDSALSDSDQDGNSAGLLSSVAIDEDGYVVCAYSNGGETRLPIKSPC
jgi:flagellar hook protein FlgE